MIRILLSMVVMLLLASCAGSRGVEGWVACRGGCLEGERLERLKDVAGTLAWAGIDAGKVHVLRSTAVAAYSWNSGDLYVTAGLMDVATDQELAAALAHEAGHLVHDRSIPAPACLAGTRIEQPDVEREADAVALLLMSKNDIAPSVLVSLLRKVAAHDRSFEQEMEARVKAICSMCAADGIATR